MDTADQKAQGKSPPARMDDIPVRLVFEVGETTLPLGELQSLQPGYTFELPASVAEPVRIRANGKIVGSGELVQVGDRVGVRVLSLGEPRHDKPS